jgi:hypothetical protein
VSLVVRLVVIIALAVGAAVLAVKLTSSDPSGPVFVYGDSNLILSSKYLEPGATVRGLGNSEMCNFFAKMKADAALKPSVVVLAFTGATFSPCARDVPRYDAYLRDYAKARALFPDSTEVFVVLPSPTRSPAEKYLASPTNEDVYKAAQDSDLPTIDAWSALGGPDAPYVVSDGMHLNEKGQRIYANALSEAW